MDVRATQQTLLDRTDAGVVPVQYVGPGAALAPLDTTTGTLEYYRELRDVYGLLPAVALGYAVKRYRAVRLAKRQRAAARKGWGNNG
jgi:hypothetical protein